MPYVLFETAIGTCGMSFGARGVTCFALPEASLDVTEERLQRHASDGRVALDDAPKWFRDAVARITKHLAGKPQSLESIPVEIVGVTPFVRAVYQALRDVPAGHTTSYGELAQTIGAAGAARAVGRAMALNPIPILIPCHRVLAAGGKHGGFSAYGGLVTKERLLALEGYALGHALRGAALGRGAAKKVGAKRTRSRK